MNYKKVLYVSPECETFGLQLELLSTGSAESIHWGGDYNLSSTPEIPGVL